jgi:hypothetical protein
MNDKESLVPEPPASETVKQKDEANRLRWVEYLRDLSPRIKIYRDVNQALLDLYKKKVLEFIGSDSIILDGWPEHKDVAFMLLWNSVPGEVHADFPLENIYLFCYGKKAFGIADFEYDDREGMDSNLYSLRLFPDEYLTWYGVTKIIKSSIEEVEDMVPDPPSE